MKGPAEGAGTGSQWRDRQRRGGTGSQWRDWQRGEVRDVLIYSLLLLNFLHFRELTDENTFRPMLRVLQRASREVQSLGSGSDELESWFQLAAECFRCLRNACVRCARNQSLIRAAGLIDETVFLTERLVTTNLLPESGLVALRCGLQFLGNAAAGNPDSQNSIWTRAFPELFLNCLKSRDDKVSAYGAMVFFTCLSEDKMPDLQDELDVALSVITGYQNDPEAEWLHLIVTGHLLKCPQLVKAMYLKQTHQERITMLEIISARFNEQDPVSSEESSSLRQIGEFISECFQSQCRAVLKLAAPGEGDDDTEALVVVRLLDVLCEMTSNNDYLSCLQSQSSLLEGLIDILRLTHLAGKQAKNIFTSVHTATLGSELTHAVVGFKAQLIRMIGNLCYKHKDNQEKVYQLDGIPLILDNCSIDDNNPFLNQWTVYAIRNLTENNERNQELIASMERQGLADTSVLKSMGYDVEERDGKLVLKSTRKS
uniref:Ataxin-10 n=2 Tax=Leptobrachium leishanense TaxID=445787 RepID=A0A8C5W741_9ANUR